MSLVKCEISLKADLHSFPDGVFGSISDLIDPTDSRPKDTLIIACSELGTAPDCVSFAKQERLVILQHLAASMPSKVECENYEGLSCDAIEQLFDVYQFRHVIICGLLRGGVIPYWLSLIHI